MLEEKIEGNTLEVWGIFFIIILGTLLFAKLVSLIGKKVILPITKKTSNKADDIIYSALKSPVLFAIILGGFWIAIHHLAFRENIMKAINDSYRILISLNFTWLIARLSNCLIDGYWSHKSDDSSRTRRNTQKMMPIVKRVILVIIWIIGIVTALGNIGVNISALIGTLGIGGIAFALAAQDTVKNMFGAFTIFTDRAFTIGDTIRIDNIEGTVMDIGIRSTKIRNYDKRLITLPNSKIADASVVNISAEPMRRVVTKIGLTYDTTPEKMNEAMTLLKEISTKVKYVTDKDLTANFSDFSDSALVITFTYFIEKKGDINKTISDVNMEILSSFNKAGLDFAFPSQTVYLEELKVES